MRPVGWQGRLFDDGFDVYEGREQRRTEDEAAPRLQVKEPPKLTVRNQDGTQKREPWDREVALARCREIGAGRRRRRLARFGVRQTGNRGDEDAAFRAEFNRRDALVAKGWTFITGEPRLQADLRREGVLPPIPEE